MAKRRISYPTHQLLAVVDDPASAPAAVDALVAAGISPADVTLLAGPDGAREMDGLGTAHGPFMRLLRIVQFTTMDQMPDFKLYEAALADGRAVIAVRVPRREDLVRARDILTRAGAHFLNYFGRFSTEEISRWRGPELDIPDYMRR